jgi:hypothetical protein
MSIIRLVRVVSLLSVLGIPAGLLAAPVLTSVAVSAQSPASIMAGASATYTVTVTRTNNGNLDVFLSVSGLPAGATPTFSPGTVHFTGPGPVQETSTLTISTLASVPNGVYPFTLVGTDGSSFNYKTAQGTLVVGDGMTAMSIVSCSMQGDSGFTLTCAGGPNEKCLIQATTDLSSPNSWITIGTNTSGADGRFSFIDADAKNYPARFYRTMMAP